MSIACVLVSHLPLKTELLRQPALQGKAALVVEQSGTQKLVVDRSSSAHDTVVGMSLEKALARCPHAALIEADMSLYRESWSSILDGLEQRSPIVEDADLGLAYVDLRGLEELYGGEVKLVKAVVDAVPQIYCPGWVWPRGSSPLMPPPYRLSPVERCEFRKMPLLFWRSCL